MASTAAGLTLTRQHRQGQLQINAQTLRRFLALWPIWRGDEPSYAQLVAAVVPLLQVQHRVSSGLASRYYQAFRFAEGVAGSATSQLAAFDVSDAVSSLYFTGIRQAQRSLAAGMAYDDVRGQTLARVSGTVSRHALNGGRDTIVGSAAADPQAVGWQRVTSGKPCPFCVMLSSRGPVYRGQQTAGFQAHDHCACMAEPSYQRGDWNPQNREHQDLYNRAQREAFESGDLARGTSNDALNALRRLMHDPAGV